MVRGVLATTAAMALALGVTGYAFGDQHGQGNQAHAAQPAAHTSTGKTTTTTRTTSTTPTTKATTAKATTAKATTAKATTAKTTTPKTRTASTTPTRKEIETKETEAKETEAKEVEAKEVETKTTTSPTRKVTTTKTTATSGTTLSRVQLKLQSNTQLANRLQSRLPSGTNVVSAASGFRNLGQFVAAVNVSHNLGIPFSQLKTDMVTNHMSLGQSIQALRPSANASKETERAETQARRMIDSDK